MDFEKFKETIRQDLLENLPQLEKAGIEFRDVEKPQNQSYTAMSITPENSSIGASVNIEKYYQQMENGRPYDEVLDVLSEEVVQIMEEIPQVDAVALTDYESMKPHLMVQMVSTERNQEMLAKVPHKEIEDMSLVYRFELSSGEEGLYSTLIRNDALEMYGITPEQLHQDAMERVPLTHPASIRNIVEVMMALGGEELPEGIFDDASPMFVASVPGGVNGAGVLAYPDFMEQGAAKLGGDFFVLPSSIHEVILLPDDGQISPAELKTMVMEVNASEVMPEEQLSDNVYYYDSKEKIFELAEKFEARQAQKERAAEEREERPSVLKTLGEKKMECAKQEPAIGKTVKHSGPEW